MKIAHLFEKGNAHQSCIRHTVICPVWCICNSQIGNTVHIYISKIIIPGTWHVVSNILMSDYDCQRPVNWGFSSWPLKWLWLMWSVFYELTFFSFKNIKNLFQKQYDSSPLFSLERWISVKNFFSPQSNNVNITEWSYKKRRLRMWKSQVISSKKKCLPLYQSIINLMAYLKC